MNIRTYLAARIRTAMDRVGLDSQYQSLVTPSTRLDFGDYQANAALPAAKALKTNPRELAQRIVAVLELGEVAAKVEIAGPGFINIHLRADWLAQQCQSAAVPGAQPAQTIVVDYSGPNLAKEMHVGHLRSTIIGDATVRVLEYLGHRVIRQNHMGDWGTQFGMLIAELESSLATQDANWALADLEAFYQQAKRHFDADPAFAERARDYVVRLQSGDAHCLQLWQRFIEVSIAHSEDIYQRLNVSLRHADIRAESAYNAELPLIAAELERQALAVIDQGALVVFLPELADKEGNPSPVIVRKSDGGYLYATTDLAAIKYRCEQLGADQILYFVDARQSLHLQQLFVLARKAGFVPAAVELKHLAFGTMMGADGKPFKTRTGGTVKLAELLDEAVERAERLVLEKNPQLDPAQRQDVARKVGIGAVKYADLAKNRTSDYVFSWDAMLSFEGNTAPYLQYAYTRIQSIFRKAGLAAEEVEGELLLREPAERALALRLAQFPETLEQVAKECAPHVLCGYLYDLASLYMSFYEQCPILHADVSLADRASRLQLCRQTAGILKRGLDLLGIEVMDFM